MSDSNLAGRRPAGASDNARSTDAVKSRSRTVKPGHLEVGEFTSGHIGASAPFGNTPVPMPVSEIHYEHPPRIAPRHLEDERH